MTSEELITIMETRRRGVLMAENRARYFEAQYNINKQSNSAVAAQIKFLMDSAIIEAALIQRDLARLKELHNQVAECAEIEEQSEA